MSQRLVDQTYYEILEISPDAAEHEIHKAYQKAKKTYSPDSPALYTMFTPDEASELSRLIEEAYSVLSNLAARREYDNRLLGRGNDNKSNRIIDKKKEGPKIKAEKLPDGYARTRHSVYEIDPAMEEKINSSSEFDGAFLKEIRSYKKINLEALSEEIRVGRTYLHSVEKNDYSALPAEVFVRGFIVQYAKALGLSPDKVANSYMKIMRNGRR